MHPHRTRYRDLRARGSVLVLCMVLAALGTIGVAAWMSLLTARSNQVDANLASLQRRVTLSNSRALARRAFYNSLLHANTGLATTTTYTLPAGLGRATISTYAAVPLNSDVAGSPSANGATPIASQTTDVSVALFDGIGDSTWIFRLRNQSPALGGDLLSLHAPVNPTDANPLVSGNLRVRGRAVLWDSVVRDLSNGLRADEYLLPAGIAGTTSLTNVAGSTVLPLNYPHYLRTTGAHSGGAAYRGELELISSSVNPQNSHEVRATGAATTLPGSVAASEGAGVTTLPPTGDDPAHLAYIAANPAAAVATYLAGYPNLSSDVLRAAVQKPLSNAQLHQVFNAQTLVPDDALTAMMAAVNEATLTNAEENAILAMNQKNGALYNVNGAGVANLYLDRSGLSRVIVREVNQLRLIGQSSPATANAAALLEPLLVIIDNRAGGVLSRIDFFHENRRPFVLAITSSPASVALPLTRFRGSTPFPTWTCVADLQNTGLAIDVAAVAAVTWRGGIRGNHRLTVSGGNLTLERDTVNAAALLPFCSRDAWVEIHRN